MNDILKIYLKNDLKEQTFKQKLKEKTMKNYLKIFVLLAILLTLTYKILSAAVAEIDSKSKKYELKESIPGGVKIKSEETGYIGVSKLTTTTFGMYDNSCSMLH